MRAAWLCLAAMLGCTGAPTPDVDDGPKEPAIPVRKSLPKARDGGPQALTQDNVRKAFEAEATVTGLGGRRCGVWRDKVVLTRPADRGGYDLRIRPSTGDIDADCQWEGPVLVSSQVIGEVVGVFWPHVVVYAEGADHSGRIQVVQGTTGGITADIPDATRPRYERQLVVSFEVPSVFEVSRGPDQSCEDAIADQWTRTLSSLERGDMVHPDVDRTTPHCPPDVLARFCDRFAFLLPHELVLGQSTAKPVGGMVGCAHIPK